MPAVQPIVTRRTLLERAREQMRQRAQDLAMRGTAEVKGASAGQMVLCAVGHDVFAIPAQRVAETLAARPLSPLPGAAAAVLGMMWTAGTPLVVLHLGQLLGTSSAQAGSGDQHIIILRKQGRQVGLLVDRVLAVAEVEAASAEASASLAPSRALQHVHVPDGLAAAPLAAVLDVDQLIPNAAPAAGPAGA